MNLDETAQPLDCRQARKFYLNTIHEFAGKASGGSNSIVYLPVD